jgi:pyruvate/2-oxoglutarate dehydrogenase complex dihydrolipoamide acyltransferase (E2) component
MATEVKVPTLGESVTEATVGAWLKKPGEAVALDEPIASLETDKVAVDVPSPVAGVLGQQLVKEGDTVNVGAVIATVEAGASAAASQRCSGRSGSFGSRGKLGSGCRGRFSCHAVARGTPPGAGAWPRSQQHQGYGPRWPLDQG